MSLPDVELRLLGPFEILLGGISVTPLPSRKVRWLLALLALRLGKETPRAWLAETLWPDSAPEKALFNLRYCLVELRKRLGDAAGCLASPTSRTLALDPERVAVDTAQFANWAGQTAPRAQERAVALYRGPLLPDCDEAWASADREIFAQTYLEALERLARDAMACREWSAAVRWLQRAVQADPYRESAHGALMQALAATGDRAALKRIYQELRRKLRDDLHAEPAPETRALYEELLGQEAQAVFTPVESAKGRPGSVPIPLTSLIDRDEEIEDLRVAMQRSRLVTLIGPGGMGKTRLAIAVAESLRPTFPEGVWFVDLAPRTAPEQVPRGVLTTLGITPDPGIAMEDTLVQAIGDSSLLLLLDNCEHLLDSCRALAHRLLSSCPQLRVLATSRELLGVTGEQLHPVAALSLPPAYLIGPGMDPTQQEKNPTALREYGAIRLFVERAVQASPRFALTSRNAGAVVEICRHLDGSPLAIEMAAARMRSLSAGEIQARLEDRFRLLTTGSKTAMPRHQTLRALMDWSHDLLDETEQTLFRRLAAFAGGWTGNAAEALAGELSDDLSGLLLSLVDKSLVVVERGGAETRYRMLETVRQYAAERLERSGERSAIFGRLVDYFTSLASVLETDQTSATLDTIAQEMENIRLALDWCHGPEGNWEKGMTLARPMYWFWYERCFYAEGRRQMEALVARAPATTKTRLYSTILRRIGDLSFRQGDLEYARCRLEQSLALDRALNDREWEGRSLYLLVYVLSALGDLDAAVAHSQAARKAFHEVGDGQWEAYALLQLGIIAQERGDLAGALAYCEQALERCPTQELSQDTAGIYFRKGLFWTGLGKYAEARALLEEMLRRDVWSSIALLGALTDLDLREKRLDQARIHLPQVIQLALQAGDRSRAIRAIRDCAQWMGPQIAAARLWAAAESYTDLVTANVRDAHRAVVASHREELQRRYGADTVQREWERGRSLSLEQAATFALQWLQESPPQ